MTKIKYYYTLIDLWFVVTLILVGVIYSTNVKASDIEIEQVKACVVTGSAPLDNSLRSKISQCLGWQISSKPSFCGGSYSSIKIKPIKNENIVEVRANSSSLYIDGRSKLFGDVEVRQKDRIVSAQTANIYRDAKTKAITKIELVNNVRFATPDMLMFAKDALIYPATGACKLNDVVYRFKIDRAKAFLPAWGRASILERFANKDYALKKATYTTCSPKDKSWQISADQITINQATSSGVAKKAYLEFNDVPIIYTPYISFPTSKERKSGFLMPLYGYTNVSGFDYAFPYYFNIAPNFDATFVPHVYTFRGVMVGGNTRFLTKNSTGVLGLDFLPKDAAYKSFLMKHRDEFPVLKDKSSNRWSVMLKESSKFSKNLSTNINYRQISDDYYFQDFSTNLSVASSNQILREGDVTYAMKNWTFFGMLQSYQTLHPINQSAVSSIYERFPQLSAKGSYYDLPLNGSFRVLGQFDNFHWNGLDKITPEGPRYHLNPVLSIAKVKPWGYIRPEVQVIENHYDLNSRTPVSQGSIYQRNSYNKIIPRYSVDSGLTFIRTASVFGSRLKESLEPHFYYLNIPYRDQSFYPSFDSAYMIFNTDQLFRNNRFSGFDRISDANQFAYGTTMRFTSPESGLEIASFSIGQIRYFSERKVQLCYNVDGTCIDSPLFLGYVSPDSTYSPIASKLSYALSSIWSASADYVWDPYTSATNNGNFNVRYQPTADRILSFGYNYIVSGNILATPEYPVKNNPLNQATASYAWPFSEKWSSLGVYGYNISEKYPMMTYFGLQYDSCCWAARVLGGRQFKSLSVDSQKPTYNNSVFFQILLKGLGSVSTDDPSSTILSYLPGYPNIFSK